MKMAIFRHRRKYIEFLFKKIQKKESNKNHLCTDQPPRYFVNIEKRKLKRKRIEKKLWLSIVESESILFLIWFLRKAESIEERLFAFHEAWVSWEDEGGGGGGGRGSGGKGERRGVEEDEVAVVEEEKEGRRGVGGGGREEETKEWEEAHNEPEPAEGGRCLKSEHQNLKEKKRSRVRVIF